MKKTKIFITAALLVIATTLAFASRNNTLHDYFYFPVPGGDPVPVQADIACPNFNGVCRAFINGGLYQLYQVDPTDSQLKPLKP